MPTWPADSLNRKTDTSLYAKSSTQGQLKSSQATIRCIVTLSEQNTATAIEHGKVQLSHESVQGGYTEEVG